MNKLLLTIDLDVNDPALNYLSEINKINYGQIVDKIQPKFNRPEELFDLRIQLLLVGIKELRSDVLIGFAINEPEHLENLINVIESTNFRITEIFHDDGTRRQQKQKAYEEEYKLHSRWLGYSPEEVKKMNDEFYEKVNNLLSDAKRFGVKCTAV